jgi:hypothetical protein
MRWSVVYESNKKREILGDIEVLLWTGRRRGVKHQ